MSSLFCDARFNTIPPTDRLHQIFPGSTERPPRQSIALNLPIRRQAQQWTPKEDARLIDAVRRFGHQNWKSVADLIDNRTASQCSQRWQRRLNPKISHDQWKAEEDANLVKLVSKYGLKSWVKISSQLGTRSDVQCRYRYQQLRNAQPIPENSASAEAEAGERAEELEVMESKVEAEPEKEMDEKIGEDPIPIEAFGLDLSEMPTTDIFWLLHP
jgi:hypothetical protein